MAFLGLIAVSVAIAFLTQQEYGWIFFGGMLILDYYIDKFRTNRPGTIDEE